MSRRCASTPTCAAATRPRLARRPRLPPPRRRRAVARLPGRLRRAARRHPTAHSTARTPTRPPGRRRTVGARARPQSPSTLARRPSEALRPTATSCPSRTASAYLSRPTRTTTLPITSSAPSLSPLRAHRPRRQACASSSAGTGSSARSSDLGASSGSACSATGTR
ncbi:hypothetical protein DMC30DRAFT_404459 [Rhodotorula diobovata]|uniref:Uncharacterized protein n=1 Tax=Rhodotorula diobovata TaxID=5288 RepID=A0A5C5FNQ9_9BASI|nr:hypothetical protein DMC30DRAFT_404459 [Rhodotorula diobovata]